MVGRYRVCVVGGWCGNRMIMVADHLRERLSQAGYACTVTTHSVWENYSSPPEGDLILHLVPAYSQAETKSPLINIRPLLADLDHPATMQKILDQVQANSRPVAATPPQKAPIASPQ